MVKKSAILLFGLILFGCKSTNEVVTAKKGLYEILIANNDGGANIKFYEIISEPKEIAMLLGDATLRKLVNKNDITTSNFIIFNLGPVANGVYSSVIQKVEETPTQIIVKVKEIKTKASDPSDENTVYPYSVIKINSKKPIVFQ